MKNEYKSFCKKDLINMINEAVLNTVGNTNTEMTGDQIAARLVGVLALSEEMKRMLDDPEVE